MCKKILGCIFLFTSVLTATGCGESESVKLQREALQRQIAFQERQLELQREAIEEQRRIASDAEFSANMRALDDQIAADQRALMRELMR
jgi:hypothetical protein